MSKSIGLNMLMEKLKNKEQLKLDLENGIILTLNYDLELEEYRGYSEELGIEIGIWKKETLIKIATEPGLGCKLILEEM